MIDDMIARAAQIAANPDENFMPASEADENILGLMMAGGKKA